MLSGKFLFTLVGIMVAIFAICKLDFNQTSFKENWDGMPQRRVRMQPVAKVGEKATSLGSYPHHKRPSTTNFIQVPKFQAMLSPRMSGTVDFGSHVYNLPDKKNMAVDASNPLAFGDMVKEGYSNSANGGSGTCGGKNTFNSVSPNKYPLKSGPGVLSADPGSNYNQAWASSSEGFEVGNDLPVGTMTTMDSAGNSMQAFVVDRPMFAPLKSRKRQHADLIRGDVFISPNCNQGDLFGYHPDVSVDLHTGSLAVMGGHRAVDQDMIHGMHMVTGGARSTIGGGDFADVDMSQFDLTQHTSQAISSMSDVTTTAHI